jgi:hypothetical protein
VNGRKIAESGNPVAGTGLMELWFPAVTAPDRRGDL